MTTTADSIDRREQRFTFYDVDWSFYETMLRRIADRHVFLTYDRGRMELMSPSYRHDKSARRIALIIDILSEELQIPILGAKSTTLRREDLEQGLEPDECFYIQGESAMRGHDEIDLTRDPPPDLAVEVEISHRLSGRERIYANLGVAELWRYDGQHLRLFELQEDQYVPCGQSRFFPNAPVRELERFLVGYADLDDTAWKRQFRQWVQAEVLPPRNR
jgi:Uma2 family endonuclease